ncbi:Predicted N-formylglutamate amidohydrolase [Lysobacter sp. yr284]|nr:Predicted N-formylglutamate amidohydrolase [Lysobacter sp. yr284]
MQIRARSPGGAVLSAPASVVLAGADPHWPAGEVFNPAGAAPLVLVCEHASNRIPPGYADLGCSPRELARHIAVDIGAAELTRGLALHLDAPAVLCTTSRLFVDCNRAPFEADWIAPVSDGTAIPGNAGLSADGRHARAALVFEPFHALVGETVAAKRRAGIAPLLVAVHSYAASLDGVARPPVAVIWDRPEPAAQVVAALRREVAPVGDNAPYDGRRLHGYTVERHARPFGLRRLAIEVRQDLLGEDGGVAAWTRIVGDAIGCAL